jgi:hypothetical protein
MTKPASSDISLLDLIESTLGLKTKKSPHPTKSIRAASRQPPAD